MNRLALVVFSTTFALLATLDVAAQGQGQAPMKQEFFPAHPVVASGQRNPAASSLVAEMMPFIGPMFVNGPEIKSTLVLANASRDETSVTVTLYGFDGSVTSRQRLPMKAHEHVEVALNLYPTPPVVETWGSVSVDQDPKSMGTVVAGQVVITDTRGAIPIYVDEELAMPEMEGSSRLLAVTDQSDGPPLVAVTNLSSKPQHLTLACTLGQNNPMIFENEIAVHAAIKLQACSALKPLNIAGYASAMNGQDSPGVYGIQIEGDGDPGSLAAFALAPHKRGSDLVFSSVPFYDPAEIHSSNVVFAGVPIGAQDTLPAGVYVPRLSLANFSGKAETFSVTLADTIISPVHDAEGREQPPSVKLLKTVSVPPHQTSEYIFTGQEAQKGLLHSIVVSTETAPGTYQAKLVSRSDGRLYQVELLAKDAFDKSDAGVHPWSSVEGTESHIVLFNHSKSDKKVGVFITGGSTEWSHELILAALETREVSINQVQNDQVPDDHGTRLPKSAKQGVINWMTPEHGDVTGRLMVTSRDAAMARNFSCGTYVSECGLQFNIYAYTVGEGSTFSMYGAQAALCINSQPLECGTSNQTSGVANYSWSVGATSVIKLSSSSQSTLQSPALTGVSVGTGYADVTAYAGQCQASGQGSPKVAIPVADRITSDNANGPASCPIINKIQYAGWYRNVNKVNSLSTSGTACCDYPVQYQNMSENVTLNAPNALALGQPNVGTATTNEYGAYKDTFAACSPYCPTSKQSTGLTQVVNDSYTTFNTSWTNSLLATCSANTENGK
jgi:hypothetical protein